jgi:hypothetical protein
VGSRGLVRTASCVPRRVSRSRAWRLRPPSCWP